MQQYALVIDILYVIYTIPSWSNRNSTGQFTVYNETIIFHFIIFF